jgi:hypothetical protein
LSICVWSEQRAGAKLVLRRVLEHESRIRVSRIHTETRTTLP